MSSKDVALILPHMHRHEPCKPPEHRDSLQDKMGGENMPSKFDTSCHNHRRWHTAKPELSVANLDL